MFARVSCRFVLFVSVSSLVVALSFSLVSASCFFFLISFSLLSLLFWSSDFFPLAVHSTPDPQETLANISDKGHSTPDPQETLVNISDTVHSTPDPQETLANISSDIVHTTPALESLVDQLCCELYH
jgi:hypothetical protein